MSREFINLKKNLKRHLSTKSHRERILEERDKKEREDKLNNKNIEAGMNLGRLAMKCFLLGRPYTDFETNVLLLKRAWGNVGELNHSRMFPANFRPYVQKVVRNRMRKMLSTPLIQTGHLVPLAVSGDKCTYKHRLRHFQGAVTISPGSENFLEVIRFGQPLMTEGSSGYELARSLKSVYNNFSIKPEQIESMVFDGVYFHCSVPSHLFEMMEIEDNSSVSVTWD